MISFSRFTLKLVCHAPFLSAVITFQVQDTCVPSYSFTVHATVLLPASLLNGLAPKFCLLIMSKDRMVGIFIKDPLKIVSYYLILC